MRVSFRFALSTAELVVPVASSFTCIAMALAGHLASVSSCRLPLTWRPSRVRANVAAISNPLVAHNSACLCQLIKELHHSRMPSYHISPLPNGYPRESDCEPRREGEPCLRPYRIRVRSTMKGSNHHPILLMIEHDARCPTRSKDQPIGTLTSHKATSGFGPNRLQGSHGSQQGPLATCGEPLTRPMR